MFFLIDDFGHTDIGYHNKEWDNLLRTPTLDQLAAEGIKLENYYVQPICTPTRSQLMSGRYQIHTGLQHGVIHPAQPSGLPTHLPILPNFLCGGGLNGTVPAGSGIAPGGLGFRCHLVGKWHLGFYTPSHCPWNRGFHSTTGYLGGMEDYWTKKREPGFDFRRDGVPDRTAATTDNTTLYSTKLYRLKAIDIIEEHAATWTPRGVPLFLYLPFQAVHGPLEAPPHWMGLQPNVSAFGGSKDRRTYAAMVAQMDFAVGKVVGALKQSGLYNNTLIVLSAVRTLLLCVCGGGGG